MSDSTTWVGTDVHKGETIRKRREGQPPDVIETARKAEVRLYCKFTRMG